MSHTPQTPPQWAGELDALLTVLAALFFAAGFFAAGFMLGRYGHL